MSERMYDLYFCDFSTGKAVPVEKVGGDQWQPMTHREAITARSKFMKPTDIMIVEVTK